MGDSNVFPFPSRPDMAALLAHDGVDLGDPDQAFVVTAAFDAVTACLQAALAAPEPSLIRVAQSLVLEMQALLDLIHHW